MSEEFCPACQGVRNVHVAVTKLKVKSNSGDKGGNGEKDQEEEKGQEEEEREIQVHTYHCADCKEILFRKEIER